MGSSTARISSGKYGPEISYSLGKGRASWRDLPAPLGTRQGLLSVGGKKKLRSIRARGKRDLAFLECAQSHARKKPGGVSPWWTLPYREFHPGAERRRMQNRSQRCTAAIQKKTPLSKARSLTLNAGIFKRVIRKQHRGVGRTENAQKEVVAERGRVFARDTSKLL